MDFLDKKKKKAHQFRLLIGYALMAIALGMSTILIVFLTSGYDVDRKTGTVIQNGLLTVDSEPVSAEILINGKFNGRTSGRLVLPEGIYEVELRTENYRPWRHKVTLEGGGIEQLVYPLLIPNDLKTTAQKTYDTMPVMVSQSPDRRWLVLQNNSKVGAFEMVDLNDDKNPRTELVLPVDTVSAAGSHQHVFKEVEWASDNNHLLLEHTWNNGKEYILLDRNNPLQSLNISKLFPDQAGFEISLRNKKPDQFYLYNPATLSLLRGVGNTKAVTPLLSNALQFKTYKDDTIIYVNKNSELHIIQKDKDYFIRSLPPSSKYLIDYAEFNGRPYLVCGSPADGKSYIYVDPLRSLQRVPAKSPQPFRVLIVDKSEFVSFSSNARFIAAQGLGKFAVFDAETGRQFRYDTKLSVEPGVKAYWMDGHRLTMNSTGKLHIFDFDGTNMNSLLPIAPGSRPYFDRDYNALFTLVEGAGKVINQRTEMVVK